MLEAGIASPLELSSGWRGSLGGLVGKVVVGVIVFAIVGVGVVVTIVTSRVSAPPATRLGGGRVVGEARLLSLSRPQQSVSLR